MAVFLIIGQKRLKNGRIFEDVMEDLEQMDESRIAGLGIIVDQLKLWLDNQK
jgi:hypothetical protein